MAMSEGILILRHTQLMFQHVSTMTPMHHCRSVLRPLMLDGNHGCHKPLAEFILKKDRSRLLMASLNHQQPTLNPPMIAIHLIIPITITYVKYIITTFLFIGSCILIIIVLKP